MPIFRPLLVLCVVTACAGSIFACSSSSTEAPTPTADAATAPDSGSSGAVDSGGGGETKTACEELGAPTTASAPEVVATKAAAAMLPVAEGGTITDGTYYLTSQVAYTDGMTFSTVPTRIIVTFKGGSFVGNRKSGQNSDDGQNIGGTFTTDNKTIALKTTCKGNSSSSAVVVNPTNTFTAKPGSFTVFYESYSGNGTPGSKIVSSDVFTKQ